MEFDVEAIVCVAKYNLYISVTPYSNSSTNTIDSSVSFIVVNNELPAMMCIDASELTYTELL